MRQVVCSVFDGASRLYGQLQVVPQVGVAARGFTDAVNNVQSGPLFAHPEDFNLVKLGEYDDNTGEIFPCSPEIVVRGKDCKVSK